MRSAICEQRAALNAVTITSMTQWRAEMKTEARRRSNGNKTAETASAKTNEKLKSKRL